MSNDKEFSDLLSYNPDFNIKPKKSLTTGVNSDIGNEYVGYVDEGHKSTVFKSFEKYYPSNTIKDIVYITDEINSQIKSFEEGLKTDKAISEYFADNDNIDKESIIANNSNSPCGNTEFEVYLEVNKIKNHLSSIKDLMVEHTYGDIDTEDYKSIDKTFIDKMNDYELNGDYTKINYSSIYFETQVNYLLNEYVSSLSDITYRLNKIKNEEYSKKLNNDNSSAVVNTFNNINSNLKNNIYIDIDNSKNLEKALKNFYVLNEVKNNYHDTFTDNYMRNDDYEALYEISLNCEKDINNAIDDVLNATSLMSITKKDITSTLRSKSKVRGFLYSNLNNIK